LGARAAPGSGRARLDLAAEAIAHRSIMGSPLIVTGMGSPVTLRLARLDDAEATRRIYNAEVATSTATFDLVPRSLDEQREWLTARSGAHAVVVADDEDGGVVGFAALSPWRSRPAYSTSVEDSIYVHPDNRGRGIGKTLLAELIDVATAHGFHAVFARIVGGHETSIRLHEAFGFDIVGTEREVGRKFGRWLDVVVMELLLNPRAPDS
jgi:L-amino acid N-acyltransferase